MVGGKLGHYHILEKIGAGGMGEVYRARDEQLERIVALKLLPGDTLANPTARARLLREARAAAALNHPHICTIHEVGEADGRAYIAMEFVSGQCLSDCLHGGGLPPEIVVRYGSQIADALAHAHERHVIHRDLKSANVVITSERRAKVLDFGLAKRLLEGEQEDLTRSQASLTVPGALMGTLAYMAPEQLRGQAADVRSDVWALGVVLYEMLAGDRPFRGETGFALSSAILNQSPPRLPAKVPLELCAIIERCMHKNPERRYQSAGVVRAALEAIGAGTVAPWEAWRYRLTRNRWPAIAAAVLGLLALLWGFDMGGLRTKLPGSAAPRIHSLAVLPLENLSGDPAQDYFADGMTDALITDLAQYGGLTRVIARSSVVRYKLTDKPLPEIARDLNVDALITGAVQRSGDRVSITAQLIDPGSGEQLWAKRYERQLRDVLSLQSEIVAAIIGEIKLQLTPEQHAQLARARPVNPEAYEAVLRARFHWQKLTREDFKLAMQYCQLALQRDPNYAPAHVCMAAAWGAPAHMGFVPPREVASKAKEAALRAIALDPTLPEAHAMAATWAFLLEWDWQTAEREYQKAGELDPTARISHADLLLWMGRRAEALAEIQRALEQDPLNAWTQAAVGGRMLRLTRYDEGITLLQKAIKVGSNMGLAHRYLWTAFHEKRMFAEAFAEAKTFLDLAGHREVIARMEQGYREGAYPRAMLRGAEALEARARLTYVQPTEIARLYLYAGEKERAFEWLEKAYEGRDTWMVFLKDDPRFNSLRSDARLADILRRMNTPQGDVPQTLPLGTAIERKVEHIAVPETRLRETSPSDCATLGLGV